MESLIEHDRSIVAGIKISDRKISILSKVCSDLRTQEQQQNKDYQIHLVSNHSFNSAHTFSIAFNGFIKRY